MIYIPTYLSSFYVTNVKITNNCRLNCFSFYFNMKNYCNNFQISPKASIPILLDSSPFRSIAYSSKSMPAIPLCTIKTCVSIAVIYECFHSRWDCVAGAYMPLEAHRKHRRAADSNFMFRRIQCLFLGIWKINGVE